MNSHARYLGVPEVGTVPETYAICDNISGETVVGNIADAESCSSRVTRMNEDYADAAKVAAELSRFVNRRGAVNEFVAATDHRTLQQGFTGLCVAWLDHLAKLEEHQYDLRNEDSVTLAKKLAAWPEWERFKYLRYI